MQCCHDTGELKASLIGWPKSQIEEFYSDGTTKLLVTDYVVDYVSIYFIQFSINLC